jgi:hypothetical protein
MLDLDSHVTVIMAWRWWTFWWSNGFIVDFESEVFPRDSIQACDFLVNFLTIAFEDL